jgi:putative glycosyltransferase (TIGR04372 family)
MKKTNDLTIKSIRKRFLIVLKTRDYSAMGRAFIYVVFCFLGRLCALPTILILYILKPFFWLKLGLLHADRLGHLALNTDLFLRRRQLGIYPDGFHYCFFSNPYKLANRQLLTMFKRVLNIYESRILSLIFSGMVPLLKRTPFYQDLPMDSNEHYEFNHAKPSIYFTPDEIEKGRKLLSQINVDLDKDKFVCIFARDDAYLKHIHPDFNWDYQNARNSDIDSLIETAKYLIEKGFIVIRIGSITNKPINFSHEKMIDYPYSGHENDFLDIFLQAHCYFTVAAGSSGCVDVGVIFDTPMLTVNFAEVDHCPIEKNGLYTPKKYKYSNTKNYLLFKNIRNLGVFWHNPAEFGLETEEASPQEILEATKEMLARVEGTYRPSLESEKLMQAYYKVWEESGLIGSISKTPIGEAWLKNNQALYF